MRLRSERSAGRCSTGNWYDVELAAAGFEDDDGATIDGCRLRERLEDMLEDDTMGCASLV
jgi:hypothetical protein